MIPAQNMKVLNITPPAAIIDNAAVTVAEVDTKGWDYCQIYAFLGATDIAMTALKVTESDTTGTGHADVTGLVYGTSTDIDGDTSALPTSTDDNGIFCFDIDPKGRKRFLDVSATCGDGSSGTYITLAAVLSRAHDGVTNISDRGLTGCLRV